MNKKSNALTVQPPIPQKQLGKYRNKKGVCLIRENGVVVYISSSKNIGETVMRLLQKGCTLCHLDRNRLTFEVIVTELRSPSVNTVLKRHFLPEYNKRIKRLKTPTEWEKRQSKRILDAYLDQSRFEVKGEHKTDSKIKKKT